MSEQLKLTRIPVAAPSSMPHPKPTDAPSELRSVDRELLFAMRGADSVSIGDLIESLGVTATAVRQRVERLLESGLIDREKVVAGRGRPTFRYRLTVQGHRYAGANPTEMADAMWREILELDDPSVREQLVSAIASRIGRQYAAELKQSYRTMQVNRTRNRLSVAFNGCRQC